MNSEATTKQSFVDKVPGGSILSDKIDEFTGETICPNCQTNNELKATRCSNCGISLNLPDKIQLSTNIWDYLDDMPYMPQREQRDDMKNQANNDPEYQKRIEIWDYFFRIHPDDVGKPQQKHIQNLNTYRDNIEQFRKNIKGTARNLWKDLLVSIKRAFTVLGILLASWFGCSALSSLLTLLSKDNTKTLSEMIGNNFLTTVSLIIPLFICCTLPVFILLSIPIFINYVRNVAYPQNQLEKNVSNAKKLLFQLDLDSKTLDDVTLEKMKESNVINARIEVLKEQIEALKRQIPSITPDQQIRDWLEEDLKRLKQQSLEVTDLGNRLIGIALDDTQSVNLSDNSLFNSKQKLDIESLARMEIENSDNELLVGASNKRILVFISPAELQDPERISPPYRPSFSEYLTRNTSESIEIDKGKLLTSFIQSFVTGKPLNTNPFGSFSPDSNKAKHLLARREATTDKGYEILFGMYYIEYLMVADDMVTLHGFFYNFITGKTMGDKITEQYYKDIVSLEDNKVYREIILGYGKDALQIEDAPSFSITLPSGEQRTITIVNENYLAGLSGFLRGNKPLSKDQKTQLDDVAKTAKENARKAVLALRRQIRLHKQRTQTL